MGRFDLSSPYVSLQTVLMINIETKWLYYHQVFTHFLNDFTVMKINPTITSLYYDFIGHMTQVAVSNVADLSGLRWDGWPRKRASWIIFISLVFISLVFITFTYRFLYLISWVIRLFLQWKSVIWKIRERWARGRWQAIKFKNNRQKWKKNATYNRYI